MEFLVTRAEDLLSTWQLYDEPTQCITNGQCTDNDPQASPFHIVTWHLCKETGALM